MLMLSGIFFNILVSISRLSLTLISFNSIFFSILFIFFPSINKKITIVVSIYININIPKLDKFNKLYFLFFLEYFLYSKY